MGDEATNEAAPEAKAPAEKKRSLLQRIPRSLIVTLLGIALTAWLLPAFTRQWGDRQKAHELKAAMVTDIASASGRVLLGGEALWRQPQICVVGETVFSVRASNSLPPDDPRLRKCFDAIERHNHRAAAKIDDPWALASFQLETRLGAYVNAKVVTAWQLYAWFMDGFDQGNRIEAKEDFANANASGFLLEPGAARAAAGLVKLGAGYPLVLPRFDYRSAKEVTLFHHLEAKLKRDGYLRLPPHDRDLSAGAAALTDPRDIESALFAFEREIARELLASHVAGYSTTTHDLIHDLIP
ncbi:MAG TPA: hypothetical protein VGQ38_01660 [Gaiellaceae bacterium]|nr:hypothetical protein [Gaiellaceae bacterium]